MAVNNWVYLPESGKYLNLGNVTRVETWPDGKAFVSFVSEDTSTLVSGGDAAVLISELTRRVYDERQ